MYNVVAKRKEEHMTLIRILGFAVCAMFATAPAWAQGPSTAKLPAPSRYKAPEIDAAGFGGALAIAVGGMFLVSARARRRASGPT